MLRFSRLKVLGPLPVKEVALFACRRELRGVAHSRRGAHAAMCAPPRTVASTRPGAFSFPQASDLLCAWRCSSDTPPDRQSCRFGLPRIDPAVVPSGRLQL